LILQKPGKKSNIGRIVVGAGPVILAILLITATGSVAGDSFLLPGVTFNNADFSVGAWCRYTVVDVFGPGERDTTEIYIAITGQVTAAGSKSFWLEMKTGPPHAQAGEGEVAKALISYDIKEIAPGDSLCHYVSKLYIKKGTGSVESADPAELERLNSSNPTSDSDWQVTSGDVVEIQGGRFVCDRKSRKVLDQREIPMGRTTLVKNDSDEYIVWFCDDIPIFRLAKCVIERVRDSRTVPPVPGIPDKGREVTKTTVELTAFGADAKSILIVP
jgi:hypothetical protein